MHLARILLSVIAAGGLTVLVAAWLAPTLGQTDNGRVVALAGVAALVAALAVGLAVRRARHRPR